MPALQRHVNVVMQVFAVPDSNLPHPDSDLLPLPLPQKSQNQTYTVIASLPIFCLRSRILPY